MFLYYRHKLRATTQLRRQQDRANGRTRGFASARRDEAAIYVRFEFYEDHVLDTSRRREIPGSEITLAFPFAVLSAATLRTPSYVHLFVRLAFFSRSLGRASARPVKPQAADDTRAKTHVWMRVSRQRAGTHRVYKARSTRNGISPRYVATYAFRK